jgi:nitrate reductase NapAB chaperone NapD
MQRRRRGLRPNLTVLDDRCLLSGLTPAQLTHAYGLDAITFPTSATTTVPGDGSGETIAIVDAYHDPTLASDLQTFDRAFRLPDPTLTVLNQAGAQTDAGWALEESLDVEWAHAMAPGAQIVVVEAQSQNLQDLMTAVDTARNLPGVVAVSMSWGFAETRGETADDVHFTTPAGHTGITFVAASGDNGSWSGAEWPAASPNVLAVGGTTLALDSAGNYQLETPWIGSGGGYSRYEPEPSYQRSVQSTGVKSTPDVAFDADPNTGVAVFATSPQTGVGSWQTVGGTSLGAPSWAAIIAIVDQGRALAGHASLDGPSQTLPALYAQSGSDFHAVSSVSFSSSGSEGPLGFRRFGGLRSIGQFTVPARVRHGFGPGVHPRGATITRANTTTGLGSPNGATLVDNLVAFDSTRSSSAGSVSGDTHAATTAPRAGSSGLHPFGGHGHTVDRPRSTASTVR